MAFPVFFLAPRELPPGTARYPNVPPVNGNAIPKNSYHRLLMIEVGQSHPGGRSFTERFVDPDEPLDLVSAQWRPAALMLRQQRALGMNGFVGLFKKSGAILYGNDDDDHNGFFEDTAWDYLESDQFATDIAYGVRICMGAQFKPSIVRVDVSYTTEKDGLVEDDKTVTVGGRTYKIPFVKRGRKVSVNTPAALDEFAVVLQAHLLEHFEELSNEDGSDRKLEWLIGATVTVTPTNNAQHFGGGKAQYVRGIAANDPRIADGRCIGRAIVMGLQPEILARTDNTQWALETIHLEGCRSDVESFKRRLTKAAIKGPVSEGAARAELKRAEELYEEAVLIQARACSVALKRGVNLSPKSPEETRTSHAYKQTEIQLTAALMGEHAFLDFRDRFFRVAQPITEETVEFIRSKILSDKVKIQIWHDLPSGGVTLTYPDRGATLSWLADGGTLVNLLARDGHVSAITNITTLCASTRKSNSRIFCGLCGTSFPHTADTARESQNTRLYKHVHDGCVQQESGPRFASNFSQSNIRQVSQFDSLARMQAGVRGFLRVADNGADLSLELSLLCPPEVGRRFFPLTEETLETVKPLIHLWRNTQEELKSIPTGSTVAAPFELFDTLLSASSVDFLHDAASWHPVLRDTNEPEGPWRCDCGYCKTPLGGPSRWTIQRDLHESLHSEAVVPDVIEDDSDKEEAEEERGVLLESAGASIMLGLRGDSRHVDWHVSGQSKPMPIHADCARLVNTSQKRGGPTITIDVASQSILSMVAGLLCEAKHIDTPLAGSIPRIHVSRNGAARDVVVTVSGTLNRKVRFVFRGPQSFVDSVFPENETVNIDSFEYLLKWNDGEFKTSGLEPLAFSSMISYGRARLLDSVSYTDNVPTSITSATVLQHYERMVKGGRMLLGQQVIWPPLPHPEDTSHMRIHFDMRAMYPFILASKVLPCQEHTALNMYDFTGHLEEAIDWIKKVDVEDETQPVFSAVINGEWPEFTHEVLSRFPLTTTRVYVQPADLSPFQRLRLGIKLSDPHISRNVAHLLPLKDHSMFVFELQQWMSLGFKLTHVGAVYAVHGSRWAAPFADRLQSERRAAEARGDKVAADAVKRIGNSVIGALNMNVADYTVLKGIKSDSLTGGGGLEASSTTNRKRSAASASSDGSRPVRAYHTQPADDPLFTGSVYACNEVTYVEKKVRSWEHRQQTAAALAVQAYGRVLQAEMFYGRPAFGSRPRRLGIVDVYPNAKVMYGNVDSLIVDLHPEGRASVYNDVRAALFNAMPEQIDISSILPTSAFWKELSPTIRQKALEAMERKGQWGLMKIEACYSAFVVNGPNRWGARVAQIPLDTPESQRAGDGLHIDVLKMIRNPAWKKTSLGQFAASWSGGHSAAEKKKLSEAATAAGMDESQVPWNGTSIWRNRSCIVSRHGAQWPFGSQCEGIAAAMADTLAGISV